MSRFYVEYRVRNDNPQELSESSLCAVIEAASLKEAKRTLPHKADFSLPDYKEDGWDVTLTYYEWTEPIKDFMADWEEDEILDWYSKHLTPAREPYTGPQPHMRWFKSNDGPDGLLRLPGIILYPIGFILRTIVFPLYSLKDWLKSLLKK